MPTSTHRIRDHARRIDGAVAFAIVVTTTCLAVAVGGLVAAAAADPVAEPPSPTSVGNAASGHAHGD